MKNRFDSTLGSTLTMRSCSARGNGLGRSEPAELPLVVAHRGYSGCAPENTLISVRLARHSGADLIEIDVRNTRDGVPIVLHDATLDRTTTASGSASALTFRELRQEVEILGAPGERIPTLAEVLEATRGCLPLAVDVKTVEAIDAVLPLVNGRGIRDEVAIWSFHQSVIRSVVQRLPHISCALLHDATRHGYAPAARQLVDDAACLGASAVSFFPEDVHPRVVETAHGLGLNVFAGTVNRPERCLAMVRAGVDGVVTDEPLGVRTFLQSKRGTACRVPAAIGSPVRSTV